MVIVSIYPCPFDNQIRHDFSASIFKNGKLYAYEEDKALGFKNNSNYLYPEISLFYGFKELKVRPEDVDKWIFPCPSNNYDKKNLFLFFSAIMKCFNQKEDKFIKWIEKKVTFIKHHDAHVGLAVGSSGFKKCIYLSQDGGGDFGDKRNCLIGKFENFHFNNLGEDYGLNNICSFHGFITDALCLGLDNGKVSGLAAYGKINNSLIAEFTKLVNIKKNGIFFNRKRFNLSKGNFQDFNIEGFQRYKIINSQPSDTNIFRIVKNYKIEDIAKTAEFFLKKQVFIFLEKIKKRTKIKNIVFSGGLFLNVSLNGFIAQEKIFKKNFFNMAPSDNGLSLGAILYYLLTKKKKLLKINKYGLTPYLGPSFNKKQIKSILKKYPVNISKPKNIYKDIAKSIASGNIVGVFDGRAEYGQRSLGNRSILADPRSSISKLRLNILLKKRDWYMPFAPSVLDKDFDIWFPNQHKSYYMQSVNLLKNKYLYKKIPSAVHVDGTCRAQYVEKKLNYHFWKIIYHFKKITKIPMVLNTSFNRHGISTISNPRQAVDHLIEGSIDLLYLNGFKVLNSFKNIEKKFLQNTFISEKNLLKKENQAWKKKIKKIYNN